MIVVTNRGEEGGENEELITIIITIALSSSIVINRGRRGEREGDCGGITTLSANLAIASISVLRKATTLRKTEAHVNLELAAASLDGALPKASKASTT